MTKVVRAEERAFDLRAEVVVAAVAHDSGRKCVLYVPERLGDDVLGARGASGVLLAEDAENVTLLPARLWSTRRVSHYELFPASAQLLVIEKHESPSTIASEIGQL